MPDEITEALAENVIVAISRIMRDLPAIAKTAHPSPDGRGGVTYKYRGIEEITAEAQQLFARHCVVPVPMVKDRAVKDITVNGNPWTDTFLEVDWMLYGPGGIHDCVPATTFGMGRDNSDKGTNKAMTQSFKYLLLDLLLISDPADDNDGTNTANEYRKGTPTTNGQDGFIEVNGEQIPLDPPMETTRSGPPSDLPTPKQLNYAKALLKGAGVDPADDTAMHTWFNSSSIEGAWPGSINTLGKRQISAVIERLKP